MRVLLIATNRHHRLMSRMDARPLPIGLAYVAGHLNRDRHTLKVLDLMFSDDYLADVDAVIQEFQPEVVGISIRNLSNHSYMDPQWALPISKEVIQRIRAQSQATIVCGGPAVSLFPKELFNYMEPDLAIAGDAGETFAELMDYLDDGGTSHLDLPGLVYREDGCHPAWQTWTWTSTGRPGSESASSQNWATSNIPPELLRAPPLDPKKKALGGSSGPSTRWSTK